MHVWYTSIPEVELSNYVGPGPPSNKPDLLSISSVLLGWSAEANSDPGKRFAVHFRTPLGKCSCVLHPVCAALIVKRTKQRRLIQPGMEQ